MNLGKTQLSIRSLKHRLNLHLTLIKFKMIIGFPYLLTRFSKWSRVASYLWSLFDTETKYRQSKQFQPTTSKINSKCHNIHIISGLILRREVSCDQKSGIDPRFWTTELICMGNPSGTSSNTICSVSTSLATLPFSFTPRFKYLK